MMRRNKLTLSRINSDIDHARRAQIHGAYSYCDAAAEYAKAKKDFIKLHERAFRSRGTWAQRSAFSAAFHKMLERMRSMHRDLVITEESNQNEISETDARFDSAFAEFDDAMRKGVDFDYQKFKVLFKDYVAWKEAPLGGPTPFDIDAVRLAISRYTNRFKTVTSVWIAPHRFDLYASTGVDGWKLRTHTAFQSMINARIPNATIAWKDAAAELRLWDSGYVFYGDGIIKKLPATAPICSLEFDVSRQMFKLDVESATLFFRKVPGYLDPAQSYPDLVDWTAFHHAFLTRIMAQPSAASDDDEVMNREIHNCGVLLRLISKTPMADISPRRLRALMSVFHLAVSN